MDFNESYVCSCGKHGYVHLAPRGYHFASKEQGLRFLEKVGSSDEQLKKLVEASALPERVADASPFTVLAVQDLNLPHVDPKMYHSRETICLLVQEPKEAGSFSQEFKEALLQSAERGDDIPCWP